MKRVAWHRLMRLGLVQVGLRPDEFWNLTPAELMLMAGGGPGRDALSREGLEALAARFPDNPGARAEGRE